MERKEPEDGPLASEALERDKWRRTETLLDENDAPGHTLPESERDRATDRGGHGGAAGGIIPPPD